MRDSVLIVDDDAAVAKMLSKVISNIDLEAHTASCGPEALEMVSRNTYALILLDINMHGMDGFEVIDRLRGQNNNTPVIIVSGRKEDNDTLHALDIGADDYVTKPFNPVTLGAKVKALIRRSRGGGADTDNSLSAGPFSYNTSTLKLYKNGEEIFLTAKENAMMKLFLDNVNRIFSKSSIYEMVWGNDMVDDDSISVYINRLRQKVEDDPVSPKYIKTVRGVGYKFVV